MTHIQTRLREINFFFRLVYFFENFVERAVIFLDSEWNVFGHKCPYTQCPLQPHGLPQADPEVLNDELEQISSIPATVLKSALALSSCDVAERVKCHAQSADNFV